MVSPLTQEEQDALEHARRQVEINGFHSLHGCPAYCRAMCTYGATLRDLKARGVEVPS